VSPCLLDKDGGGGRKFSSGGRREGSHSSRLPEKNNSKARGRTPLERLHGSLGELIN